jgi:NCAIR mutase (PurE)-related protein
MSASATEESNAHVLESFATIDHTRQARTGFPEAVFSQGKTPHQVAAILDDMAQHAPADFPTAVLATRYEFLTGVLAVRELF